MIIYDNKGKTRQGADTDRTIEILLNDMHGEYTGTFDDYYGTIDGDSATWVRVQMIWNHFTVADIAGTLAHQRGETAFPDALGERKALTAAETIFGQTTLNELCDGADTPDYIWYIAGHPKGLERAFDRLALALDVEDGVSGDDDAFDYWPNTMDMLYQFAQNLDDIKRNDLHTRLVRDIAARVLRRSSQREGYTDQQVEDQRALLTQEWGYPNRWEK